GPVAVHTGSDRRWERPAGPRAWRRYTKHARSPGSSMKARTSCSASAPSQRVGLGTAGPPRRSRSCTLSMAGFRAFHLLGYRVRVQPREELLGIHQPRGDQLRRDPDPWLQVPRHNPLPAKGKGLDSNEPMAATRVTEGKPAEATSGRGPPA